MNLEKTKWPDGKKCAAMLTINLNAELFWLQIDPSCKDMPKTLSLGQYGMTRGVDRILSILKERGIKATFFTPGWVAEQYPDKLKRIKEEGHEIASLAYKHENMALLTEEEQEDMLEELIDRFGDPPRKVQQLLMIAQLKAKAHAAYVISVEQKGDEYKFTMYEKARVNVAKIPELLAKYKGELTFKTDAENPYFIYCKLRKNKKEKAEQILENAGKIVEDIQGLVEE